MLSVVFPWCTLISALRSLSVVRSALCSTILCSYALSCRLDEPNFLKTFTSSHVLTLVPDFQVELSPSDSLEVFDPGTVPGSAWPRPVDCGVLQFGASRSLIIRAKV